MQHDLCRIAGRVVLVSFAPVVTNGISENGTSLVERGGRDGSAHIRIPLEPVLGILVPEVERAVGSSGAEGAVDGVEGDVIDGVDVDGVVDGRITVALEREVGAVSLVSKLAFAGVRACGRAL
jgi:hypothetical protein